MIISHRPSCLQGFFAPIEDQLSKPRFRHLWSLLLALVVNLRASKLSHLTAAAPKAGHRTGHGSFLCGNWGAAALVEDRAMALLGSMRPKAGEVVSLLLDDTRIAKRGKQMARLSKVWDHKQQKFVRGHVVLLAAVRFRGVVLPWRVELWKPKGQAASAYAPRYRKLTDMAAALVKAFDPPPGVKARVLFDAFYLCPQVAKACAAKGFTFFSVAAKNRSFKRDGDKRKKGRKIAVLAPGLVRHHGKGVRMKRARGYATLRIACVDGHLSRIGKVRLVLSKRPRDPWKKVVAVVTSETKLKARDVVAAYETRWDIEVLFKELRQDLGLGDYQVMSEDAIVNHLHLCCLAHQLLTHHAPRGVGARARKANTQVKLPTMNQRLEDLRHRIAREQIGTVVGRIAKGEDHEKLRRKLRHYLREHLPAA